jgi:hypothetical protein
MHALMSEVVSVFDLTSVLVFYGKMHAETCHRDMLHAKALCVRKTSYNSASSFGKIHEENA